MKTFDTLIQDLPLDHLIAAILVVASLIFIISELRFEDTPKEKPEENEEVRYYVEPRKESHRSVMTTAIFLLVLIAITITVLYFLDVSLAKGRR